MSKLNLGKDLYIAGRIGWRGLSKDEYLKKSKYRIINATSLMDGYIDWENCGYISKERFDESPEIQLKENDILISKDGTLGKIGYVKNIPGPCSVASGIFVIRNTIPNMLDFDYLYHILKSNIFKEFIIRNKAVGSTINHLYQRDLVNFEIELPSYEEQKKIAGILNSIDKKISINNTISSQLESLAKTIYDYWFLQFDFPDENGNPYRSSGGKMVWNDELKREIPEGWEVTSIGEITECYDSKRIPLSAKERNKIKGNIPYIGATGIMDYVNKAIFNDDYVLVAEDGSIADKNGFPIVQRINGPVWINNHTHVLKPIGNYECKVLEMIIKSISVVKIKTGSIQAKINQTNLNKYKIVDYPKPTLSMFNTLIKPLDNQILEINKENQQLASLRDFLLPLLMNGQVTVK